MKVSRKEMGGVAIYNGVGVRRFPPQYFILRIPATPFMPWATLIIQPDLPANFALAHARWPVEAQRGLATAYDDGPPMPDDVGFRDAEGGFTHLRGSADSLVSRLNNLFSRLISPLYEQPEAPKSPAENAGCGGHFLFQLLVFHFRSVRSSGFVL